MLKFGVMASGGGSNFQVILERIASGDLQARCEFLITNNSRCGAAEKAREAGIAVYHVSAVTHPDPQEYEQAMGRIAAAHSASLLVLAGYMKKVPDILLRHFSDAVINTHPALLPAFGGHGLYGMHVHEAVVAAGVRVSGPTIHFVDGVYDNGRIIAQKAVTVNAEDTPEQVAERVLAAEHDLYWRVIQAFAENKVRIADGKVYSPAF